MVSSNFPQISKILNFNSRFRKHSFSVNSFISKVFFFLFFPRHFCFHDSYNFCSRLESAISLHAQVQFHAKYPLFDSQSERGLTFSYAIRTDKFQTNGRYLTVDFACSLSIRFQIKSEEFHHVEKSIADLRIFISF